MPPDPPTLLWRSAHLPRRGNAAVEYEDAAAADGAAGRFAVADGASESSFAGCWARLLAEGFARAPVTPDTVGDWLAPLRRAWRAEVDQLPLPWYAEVKRAQGAFATLLGFSLVANRRWRAFAVGDSCLFHVRGDRLLQSFPIVRAIDFDDRPDLLGTAPGRGEDRVRAAGGSWQSGDRFWLMTDALACWFLGACAAGRQPWRDLDAPLGDRDTAGAFAAWVEERRDGDGLRNDDVTVVALEMP